MIQKLRELKKEYASLVKEMALPSMASEKYRKNALRIKEIAPVAAKFDEFLKVEKQANEAKDILKGKEDSELREIAEEELKEAEKCLNAIEKELAAFLTSQQGKPPGRSSANITGVIMEIRSGAGGEEAAIFARNLFEMYSKYAEKKGWNAELIDCHRSEMGGFKEIIFGLDGKGIYDIMRHEGGVHRVQRVPVTESGGRIHTSTVTVAVLPESEEVEIKINSKDLRVDLFRASGAGGQHVNVTDSAIRITHLPTGITVQCQDERSQHKNRAKAMRVLKARLTEHSRDKKQKEIAEDRSTQVQTGDRSQKIRTYNFPQNRVTDHRINLALHKLENIMKGDLDQLFSALAKL